MQNNDIEIHSVHNEEKPIIAERFIRTLKNKIYKYITSISKNVYIDELDNIVKKYNNTYHRKIKMKPVDVMSNTYIESSKEINDKDRKFKIFAQNITLQIKKKFLSLKKLKILCRGHLSLMMLMEKKLVKLFTKKNYKNQIKKYLELKK